MTKGGHECAGGRLKRANPAASQMCGVASPQGSATSEHHGPSLRVGLLPSVGDAVNLQPGRVERGQQITLVAELNGGGCSWIRTVSPARSVIESSSICCLSRSSSAQPPRSRSCALVLSRVTVSRSGAEPTGLTKAATMRRR